MIAIEGLEDPWKWRTEGHPAEKFSALSDPAG